MAKAKGLGRGLDALFFDNEVELTGKSAESANEQVGDSVIEIDRTLIEPNPDQPRKHFDQTALQELADSIVMHGIIQPIVVVKRGEKYMIIAGERRWRASELAGIKKIPVIINKSANAQKIKELSLIENLQREDLNPIEEATAIRQLMTEFGFTQEQVADRLGKNRSTVANCLRLLNLSPLVIELVASDNLSAGHARALITVTDHAMQYMFAKTVIENGLSVRDLEKMIRKYHTPKDEDKPTKQTVLSIDLRNFQDNLARSLGTKVSIIGNDSKGRIYIDYFTKDDLDRINDIINKELSRESYASAAVSDIETPMGNSIKFTGVVSKRQPIIVGEPTPPRR